MENLDYFGVTRIYGELRGLDRERCITVDSSGQNRRARGLCDEEGLSGQKGFIHASEAVKDDSVYRAKLMGVQHHAISHSNRVCGDVQYATVRAYTVSGLRHTFGESSQYRGRSPHGKLFEGLATGEHQNHDRSDPILPQDNGGGDRQDGERIDT